MDYEKYLKSVLNKNGYTNDSDFDVIEDCPTYFGIKCFDGSFTLIIKKGKLPILQNVFLEWEDLLSTLHIDLSVCIRLTEMPKGGISTFMEYLWKAYDLRNDILGIDPN